MKYYLGIDGGGTKTHACLIDEDARPLGDVYAVSVQHYNVGIEGAAYEIMGVFARFEEQFKIKPNEYAGVCFAGAGVDREFDVTLWQGELSRMGVNPDALVVCGDGPSSVAGANGAASGGVIAAGTGSIACGVRDDGVFVRAGGYGYRVDDLGSGYAIACDGIHATLEMYDGRGPHTAIFDALLRQLNLPTMDDAIGYIYDTTIGPREIAALCVCVSDLAGRDAIADAIIDKAAHDLHKMVVALAKNMRLNSFSLGLCGGVLTHVPTLRSKLIALLRDSHPGISPHAPLFSTAYGAALLAVRGK